MPIVFENILMPNASGGPNILTSVLPNGVQGTFYTFTMTASGGTLPYVWSLAGGTLDSGVTLSAAGVLSGTPANAETDNIVIRVTDAHGLFITKAFSLTFTPVINPLVITTTSPLPNGSEFNAYTTTLTGTGGTPPYTWSIISGAFQTGITLNSSTGVISGTPTASGTDTVTIQLQDSVLATTSKVFSLTITAPAPLTITTTSPLPSGTIGTAYSQTLNATGGITPYIWTILSGSLQAGLSLSSGGTISGTPSVAATDTVTIQVQDNVGTTASKTFTLTINTLGTVATPTFSPTAGTYGSTQTVTISCSTPSSSIYFTIDGSTPTFPITGTTTLYTGSLTVSATTTVKAIGILTGWTNSAVGSATYVIGALSFDFFISPNGDDATGDGSLGNPWSITALNTKQSTYRSKRVGIIGDIAGVQTHIQQGSVNGTKTTLFSVLNGAGSLSAIVINGGTSTTPTYVGSCTSAGVYRAQWAIIDASQPGTGTLPSSDNASLIGQQQGSALAPANFGWLTIDGLVVKNSCYAGIIIGSQSEATIIPGIIIQNCEVGPQVCQSSDENPGGILLGVCNGAQILNCFIHDCTNTSSFPIVGTGGITTFRTLGLIVTNCTIVRNGYCIQNKDNNQWGTYSYNYFDVGQMGSYSGQLDASIIKSCEPASGQTLTVHHNICVGAGLYWGAGASGGNNISGAVDIHNNTLYTPTQEGWATWYNCNAGAGPFNFYNNVVNYHTYGFSGNGTNAFFVGLVNTGIAGALIDYNYFGTGMNWQIVGTKYSTLAAWQAAVSQDSHSISTAITPFAGTPTFEVSSSFAVTGAALTGSNTGGIMGALDGTGSIGCSLAVN